MEHLIAQGNAHEDAGRSEDALQLYQRAIAMMPGHARCHLNAGNALLALGRAEQALAAYGEALAIDHTSAAAHYNTGNAHAYLNRYAQAAAAYERAIELKPGFADAMVALGNAQDELRLYAQAAASYTHALATQPGYAQAWYNLGQVQRQLGDLDSAEASCRRAVALGPDMAQAHNHLGVVLLRQKRWPEALATFRRGLALDPQFGSAAAQAIHCANHLCDWSSRGDDEAALAAMIERNVAGISPFTLLATDIAGNAPLLQKRAAQLYAQEVCGRYFSRTLVDPAAHPRRDRLRIGYLSADFHEHATMHLMGGVLRAHDRGRFAVHCYSYGRTVDEVTGQASTSSEVFRDVAALSALDAAAQIAADGIDILVELKGFTHDTRMEIPALRPAPVIVSWLGYPATLGHPRLADYVIGDPMVTPPEHSAHFSETLALMPHCYQPNDRDRVIGPRPSRAEAGLPQAGFVFCSFNQSYKFAPATFGLWCRLLAHVPGSVLWLLAPTEPAMDNLRREAAARGIEPQRLVFAPTLPLAAHLGRLQLADLALDTFPYTSHTTASDALWAGVPLVTRIGDTFASRVGASLLRAAGQPELITTDWESYFALAAALALDPGRLAHIRRHLQENRMATPLFDTHRFTRDLERLYLRIWQQHSQGIREAIVLAPQDTSPAAPPTTS